MMITFPRWQLLGFWDFWVTGWTYKKLPQNHFNQIALSSKQTSVVNPMINHPLNHTRESFYIIPLVYPIS